MRWTFVFASAALALARVDNLGRTSGGTYSISTELSRGERSGVRAVLQLSSFGVDAANIDGERRCTQKQPGAEEYCHEHSNSSPFGVAQHF